MASFISVPRDLSRVKSKILFNLTKRQLLCFGTAAAIGLPSFFALKTAANTSVASLGMILIMLPIFLLAMYEKDGQPRQEPLRVLLMPQSRRAPRSLRSGAEIPS